MVLFSILVKIHAYLLFFNLCIFNPICICILLLDLERPEETEWNFFTCHCSQCYKLETIPDEPNIFLSCSEDGTVRQYDLRTGVKCTKQRCNNVNQMIFI